MTANGSQVATVNGRLIGLTADFLGLTDTPAAYAGQAGLRPRVNVGEDALEFAAGGVSVWTKVYDGGVPSASVWSYGTDLKGLPRYGIAVVEESGKIYAFGGAPDDVRVDCYDPALDTWSSKGDAAGDINYSAANSVAGLIYMIINPIKVEIPKTVKIYPACASYRSVVSKT